MTTVSILLLSKEGESDGHGKFFSNDFFQPRKGSPAQCSPHQYSNSADSKDSSCWKLSKETRKKVKEFEDYDKAYAKALKEARASRPSKLEVIKETGSRFEIFPRNPI